MPKVSICIPAYNQTKILTKTLDSILIQSFTDYEIIVTDDSPSTIVKDLLNSYDFKGKLKYFHNTPALGSPQNWNYCIGEATGDYIKIMHHDDWFNYDYSLTEYVKLLDNNPDATLAFSSSAVLFSNGDNWIHSVPGEELLAIQSNPVSLFSTNKIGAPSAVIFRNTIKTIFDKNLKWLVDIEFYIQVLMNNKTLAYNPQPLITTFGDEGRVTDECIDNEQVEIFEHFYLADKISKLLQDRNSSEIKACYIHLVHICNKYNVRTIAQIRACGVEVKIPAYVKWHLFQNRTFSPVKVTIKSLIKRLYKAKR
jgi:glycosyltransferase involved in cell wall biosynthesis